MDFVKNDCLSKFWSRYPRQQIRLHYWSNFQLTEANAFPRASAVCVALGPGGFPMRVLGVAKEKTMGMIIMRDRHGNNAKIILHTRLCIFL